MKKRRNLIIVSAAVVAAVVIATILVTGHSPANRFTDGELNDSSIVEIPQRVIDGAVADCANSTQFSVCLPEISINYTLGDQVNGAIVVHNGGSSKLIKLTCESDLPELQGWVTIEEASLYLEGKKTEVVSVTLLVPRGTEGIPKHWAFDVVATEMTTENYEQSWNVQTSANETTADLLLDYRLAGNSLSSVLRFFPSIREDEPYAISYDTNSSVLRIGGLVAREGRGLTIRYATEASEGESYKQKWLIDML